MNFRVQINLNTGDGRIAMHFNPRCNQGCVIRNSKVGGWGREESSGPMPFAVDQTFEMIILVEEDNYLVSNEKYSVNIFWKQV